MKKGFTLVELMAVMIILGILTLIAVPAVTSMIKTSKEDALNITINNIKLAMRDFNKDYNLDSDGEIYLTISMLIEGGYLDGKIYNPSTNEVIPNDTILKIVKENGITYYNVNLTSGTRTEDYNILTPYIEISSYVKKINVGDEYVLDTPIAYHGDGTEVTTNISTQVMDDATIDTSNVGIYHIKYSATIDNIPVSTIQTLVIGRDTPICRGYEIDVQGQFKAGDSYYCYYNVKEEKSYKFYVLNEQNDIVTLILEKNLGDNVAWNNEASTSSGPVSLNSHLKMMTREWVDLNAYIPTYSDMPISGNNLPYWSYKDTSVINGSNGTMGYWLNDSVDDTHAYVITTSGEILTNTLVDDNTAYGLRPVIKVLKSKMMQ